MDGNIIILVLVEDYPNLCGGHSMEFVHTRLKEYDKSNICVEVLNFSAKSDYLLDGIQVITYSTYIRQNREYDALISHAPNLRHHLRFLLKYGDRFRQIIFFFHGHEVLNVNKVYPRPYAFREKRLLEYILQEIYDKIKLRIWNVYFLCVLEKSTFVFVSKWMKKEFIKWTGIKEKTIAGRNRIIYNCVGKEFEEKFYKCEGIKKYDFVTIRGNLDGAKYAIDYVNKVAMNTPNGKFLVIGKGDYFKYNNKSSNITWVNKLLSHNEIITVLNNCRYAFMPTRLDAQGVMMCEMAALGMPLITSNIDVCHEVLDDYPNAYFVDLDNDQQSLTEYLDRTNVMTKYKKFYGKNTVDKEIKMIKELIKEKSAVNTYNGIL